MRLTRSIRVRLAIFLVITLIGSGIMAFNYIKIQHLVGIGQYSVSLDLKDASGLYRTANVTYRGEQVGTVSSVTATRSGVRAVMDINSSVKVPSDVEAQVHSVSAIGEQYIDLIPRDSTSAPLRDGSVIPVQRTSQPPDIGTVIDGINKTLASVPQDKLQSTIDNGYLAFNGRGLDLRRLISSISELSKGARATLDPTVTLIDDAGPVLRSQADTASNIRAWASNLADITGQLRDSDAAVQRVLKNGPDTADRATELLAKIQPTLPILLSNLVSVGNLAVTYNKAIEQLLVLLPIGTQNQAAVLVPNINKATGAPANAANLSFNLNLNLPQPCTTGFLPSDQRRSPNLTDTPARPDGLFYCRIPQNGANVVRGLRNLPCLAVPGKRAPSAQECKSDESYVQLNDGRAAVGDPNATNTGQGVPQFSPTPASNQIAVAQYDPSTGSYVGPDGQIYSQTDLAPKTTREATWQQLMMPSTR